MRELHLREPLWLGDRSNPFVGIARHRVMQNGIPAKGKIRIWIDYKETDQENPRGWKLVYPYPFDILCSEVVKYSTQVLNDYHHTVLYLVPIKDLTENKHYRSGSPSGRTMPQSDFQSAIAASNAVKGAQDGR